MGPRYKNGMNLFCFCFVFAGLVSGVEADKQESKGEGTTESWWAGEGEQERFQHGDWDLRRTAGAAGLGGSPQACYQALSTNSSGIQVCGGIGALPGPGEPTACRGRYGNWV